LCSRRLAPKIVDRVLPSVRHLSDRVFAIHSMEICTFLTVQAATIDTLFTMGGADIGTTPVAHLTKVPAFLRAADTPFNQRHQLRYDTPCINRLAHSSPRSVQCCRGPNTKNFGVMSQPGQEKEASTTGLEIGRTKDGEPLFSAEIHREPQLLVCRLWSFINTAQALVQRCLFHRRRHS
jgi:hypothetical protein